MLQEHVNEVNRYKLSNKNYLRFITFFKIKLRKK